MKALLLDDDLLSVQLLLEEVDWKGCGIEEVHGVSSVRAAKEYLRSNSVNILLCDIEMPGESGLDLVAWCTEYARFSSVPMVCIMLTCHPDYEYLRKALQLGCQDYLLKPVNFADLTAALQKAVATVEKAMVRQGEFPTVGTENGRELVRAKILPYLEENLTKPLTVAELADLAALNPEYLMRVFKKETGLSILDYVQEKKIAEARKMLTHTSWPVEVIAERLGYGTPSYFYKCFKRHEGITPREYRKREGAADE